MRARLVAFSPNSPNETELPRWAKPVFVPLNCLRYLVRLGCCMFLTSGRGRGGGRRGTRGCGLRLGGLDVLRLELFLREHFALEDPHLDADDAVGGAGFAQAVVDVGAEGVQRHAAFARPLGARDFRAVQAARQAYFHAQGARAHGAHHRALHGAAEHHAFFDLLGDAVSDQLCIELRLADLGDVQAHVLRRQLEHLRRLGAQLLDVLALLADHDARTRGLDRDVDALGGALDQHAADRRVGELLLQELAHAEIGVHVDRELLLVGVPLGYPVTGDAKSNGNWIDLLTHDLLV